MYSIGRFPALVRFGPALATPYQGMPFSSGSIVANHHRIMEAPSPSDVAPADTSPNSEKSARPTNLRRSHMRGSQNLSSCHILSHGRDAVSIESVPATRSVAAQKPNHCGLISSVLQGTGMSGCSISSTENARTRLAHRPNRMPGKHRSGERRGVPWIESKGNPSGVTGLLSLPPPEIRRYGPFHRSCFRGRTSPQVLAARPRHSFRLGLPSLQTRSIYGYGSE
jgi:hypothetical protein